MLSRDMGIEHELRLRVRYSETDQMGVVHHSSYVIWLEEGRTALMREIGVPYAEVERSGFAMGVRKLDVRYRRPARYGDEILVRTWIQEARSASVSFGYEVLRASDEEVLLTGRVETVSLALDGMRPAPLPEAVRESIRARLAPEA